PVGCFKRTPAVAPAKSGSLWCVRASMLDAPLPLCGLLPPFVASPGASAGKATLDLGPSLAHGHCAAIGLLPIQGRDRGLGLLFRPQFHKSEAFRPAGVPVANHLGRDHGAV